jgi:hypothetical protein
MELLIFIVGGLWFLGMLLRALGVIKPDPPRRRTPEERLRDLEDQMHTADMVVGMMAMDEMEHHFRETGHYF